MKLTGSLLPPPDRSQLNLRLAAVDLRSWAELIPLRGRVAGVVDANLRVDEPLAPGVPNLVQGSVSVSRLSISDERREVIGGDRVVPVGVRPGRDQGRAALAHQFLTEGAPFAGRDGVQPLVVVHPLAGHQGDAVGQASEIPFGVRHRHGPPRRRRSCHRE